MLHLVRAQPAVCGHPLRWSRDLSLLGLAIGLGPAALDLCMGRFWPGVLLQLFVPLATVAGGLGLGLGWLAPWGIEALRRRGLGPGLTVALMAVVAYWWGFATTCLHGALLGFDASPVVGMVGGLWFAAIAVLLAGPYLVASTLRAPTLPFAVAGGALSALLHYAWLATL